MYHVERIKARSAHLPALALVAEKLRLGAEKQTAPRVEKRASITDNINYIKLDTALKEEMG